MYLNASNGSISIFKLKYRLIVSYKSMKKGNTKMVMYNMYVFFSKITLVKETP